MHTNYSVLKNEHSGQGLVHYGAMVTSPGVNIEMQDFFFFHLPDGYLMGLKQELIFDS